MEEAGLAVIMLVTEASKAKPVGAITAVLAVEISYWMAQPGGSVVNKAVSNFVVEYYDV